jgi:hypothetical protein
MGEELDIDDHIDKQLKKLDHNGKMNVAVYIDGIVARNRIFRGNKFQE